MMILRANFEMMDMNRQLAMEPCELVRTGDGCRAMVLFS